MTEPTQRGTAPLRIGLTGGIGSGKSTVAHMLAQHGAGLIDADALSRELTGPGGGAITDILRVFGDRVIDASGALDRTYMRGLVFGDPQSKKALEAILHPMIAKASAQRAETLAGQGLRCLLFDVPLLVESRRWRASVDLVLVVDCEVSTQVQRVMARSALSQTEVEAIVAHQSSRQQRLHAADLVLYNDQCEISDLEAEVEALAAHFGL